MSGEQAAVPHRDVDVVVVAPLAPDIIRFASDLTSRGLTVQQAHDADSVARAVVAGKPDVAVLDLRAGDALAAGMLRWVCSATEITPVVITDFADVETRLWSLGAGATDQLVAPFDVREAVARVDHAIARHHAARPVRIEIGDLVVDDGQRCAYRGQEVVPLTPRELSVLRVLIRQHDTTVAKHELLSAVWGDPARTENVVEVNVSSLRRKLHAVGPPVIHTVHRCGYVFRPVPRDPNSGSDAPITARSRRVDEPVVVGARSNRDTPTRLARR